MDSLDKSDNPLISEQKNINDTLYNPQNLLDFIHSEKIVFINLSAASNELLMIICNQAIIIDYPIVSLKEMISKVNIETTSKLKNSEAFKDLLNKGFIKLLTPDTLGNDSNGDIVRISNFSLERFFRIFLKDYEVIKKTVIDYILYNASIHNCDMLKSEVISKMLKQQKLVINTILECLEKHGKISLERSFGENWVVKKIKHEMFRRIIKNFT